MTSVLISVTALKNVTETEHQSDRVLGYECGILKVEEWLKFCEFKVVIGTDENRRIFRWAE